MLLILIRESARETLYCSIEAQYTRGRGTYATIFDIAIFVFVIILIIIIHITIIIILSRLVVLSILVGEHMSQFSTLLFIGQTQFLPLNREKNTKKTSKRLDLNKIQKQSNIVSFTTRCI